MTPRRLKACITGCESFDKLSDTEFQAVAVTKIGPSVKAKFKGKVTLLDLDPPNGYKISGQVMAAWQVSPPVVRP
jgi:carbon monoxide dehydrogenase subunit G